MFIREEREIKKKKKTQKQVALWPGLRAALVARLGLAWPGLTCISLSSVSSSSSSSSSFLLLSLSLSFFLSFRVFAISTFWVLIIIFGLEIES